jgi:tetratricopeptide (TPR) repeat protein
MRTSSWPRVLFAAACLAFPLSAACAADEPEAASSKLTADSYEKINKDFNDAQQAFMKVYATAKDDAERQKLVEEKYPRPEKYADRYLAFARTHPDDPAAVEALGRVVSYSRSGEPFKKALELLTTRYVASEKLTDVVPQLVYSGDPSARAALATITDKSPHRAVKGAACYALAAYDMNRDNAAEAEKRFEEVIEKYGDLPHYRGTLAEAAKAQLFEIRDLAIGKPAPDIEGEDVEGHKFKLSEYRGKVVVLDFWGDW